MTVRSTVLKPGLLVSLKSSVRGGVSYKRIELEPEHDDGDGGRLARWETVKYVPDPEEFERANIARGKARAAVAKVCCPSSFGLLCPTAQEFELKAAVEAARAIAAAHNAGAAQTRVEVYVLVGRVAQDDKEAARAIGAEVRELLDEMRAGIAAANPETIREAANKARALGGMLTDDVGAKVDAAIVEARRAARELVKRVEKSGEAAAAVIAECSVRAIEAARFSFLDLEIDADRVIESEAPAARSVELPPEIAEPGSAAPEAMSLPFQLEV